jgi:hypothetical protein
MGNLLLREPFQPLPFCQFHIFNVEIHSFPEGVLNPVRKRLHGKQVKSLEVQPQFLLHFPDDTDFGRFIILYVSSQNIPHIRIWDRRIVVSQEKENFLLVIHENDTTAVPFHPGYRWPPSSATRVACAARTSAGSSRRHVRGNSESSAHRGGDIIDSNRFNVSVQLAIDDKSESVFIEGFVVFFRPVQGHPQRGAASTPRIQEDPNRREFFLVLQIVFDHFTCLISNLKHCILL